MIFRDRSPTETELAATAVALVLGLLILAQCALVLFLHRRIERILRRVNVSLGRLPALVVAPTYSSGARVPLPPRRDL